MNVYVESNFVLELALEQEQCESCERLVRFAAAGSIHLIIPAFSLAEPYLALATKEKTRSKLANELKTDLMELGRSKPYRKMLGNFTELSAVLILSAEQQRKGLEHTIETLLKISEIIPLNANPFHYIKTLQVDFLISAQDSIVLASILEHLTDTNPPESCFLNRNTKDFDDPNIRDMLDAYNCKFFGRFDEGLRYIEARTARGTGKSNEPGS